MKFNLIPRSLGGQLLATLLLALAVIQALSLMLTTDERNRAVRAATGLEAAGRAANVAMLLDDAPVSLHASILRSANSPLVSFELGDSAAAPGTSDDAALYLARMSQILGIPAHPIGAEIHARSAPPTPMPPEAMPRAMRAMHDAMREAATETEELTLSIMLARGNWLNVRTNFMQPAMQWSPASMLPLGLMALAVALVALLTARRVVGPIRALAAGAERLGRGLDVGPLPLAGPSEVRDMTRAFNRMQGRLTRFVADRTQMLAALSHDLRSPLTAMRLRLEMLPEDEDSTRLRALVEEMTQMVQATLDFARGAAQEEPAAEVDLVALLADLVADAETGKATLDAPRALHAVLRPTAMKRALRNLIDNALRYGAVARVALGEDHGMAVITISDDGPGLPEDQLEKMFDPFVRLEDSRSRDTGGVGLGLAIARTVVQAHGGEVSLANRPEGGLVARVVLPLGSG